MTTARPTQRERRERTVARIIDATIAALAEVGYVRTTVTEIGARAEVSQGGLFRHFAGRAAIIVAAAEEVAARQLVTFRAQLEGTDGSLRSLLILTRDATRAPINAAWHELLSAARTDAGLRVRMAPTVQRYYARIVELAREQPALAAVPDDALVPLVMTAIHVFDGEALAASVYPQPELDDAGLDLLEALAVIAMSPRAPLPARS